MKDRAHADEPPPLDRRLRDALASDAMWAPPPDDLRRRVLDATLHAPGPPPAPPGTRRRRAVVTTLAAATLAMAAGYGLGLLSARDTVPGGTKTVALAGTDLAPRVSGQVLVRETPSGVEIILEVAGLPPAGRGRYYQGWVKGTAGTVTIGTFHLRDSREPVVLWAGVDVQGYPLMTITLQQEGKGPASSGKVVATAALTP
ncbi:anti-sigma factor [Sphaerisporangium sp. B11E5]|uniref:anti-sigma factor n=1 Tax=Sphaerisporangium sp. B11E5 TaxID=3153563 RepID=UPI00325DE391